MKMIEPMTVTDTELLSSNISENDHSEWDISTTYAADDYVIVIGTTHKVYQSIAGSNLGNDPVADNGTNWVEISATNRWKAFDLKLADTASKASSITYSIVPSSIVTGMAFFGLDAATVRVQIYDDDSPVNEIYDTTIDLVDSTEVNGWFSFFFGGVSYDSEAMFIGIPGYTGYQIDITISATAGNAVVGQIVLGQVHTLGETLDGTTVGIEDFSTKDRDDFGNAIIVGRAFIDETEFNFSMRTDNARWVKRRLASVRSTPAVYFVDDDTVRFGTTVFGFYQSFSIPLSAGGTSFATLEIEGLI